MTETKTKTVGADIVIQNMLKRLGFNNETAQYLVNIEGINTAKAIGKLNKELIITLTKNCRAQPSPRNKPQSGPMITAFQGTILRQVAFWTNFKLMTSRVPVFDAIDEDSLTELD